MYTLNDKEFKYITDKVYNYARINLTEKKRSLIVSRLSKRIRKLGLSSFTDYVNYLKNEDVSEKEFLAMVDALSTNYSLFFREKHHFDFLTNTVLPESSHKELKIWSAASSTGQEVYSILMTILEYEKNTGKSIRRRLYASDISKEVLQKASAGVYNMGDTQNIDSALLKRYFLRGTGEQEDLVKIKKDLIREIRFFRLNLNDKKYNLPKMDIIFLRNAIIYFDKQTKMELIERLHSYLTPGGFLILGHSESLSGISEKYSLIGKTIYRKEES